MCYFLVSYIDFKNEISPYYYTLDHMRLIARRFEPLRLHKKKKAFSGSWMLFCFLLLCTRSHTHSFLAFSFLQCESGE